MCLMTSHMSLQISRSAEWVRERTLALTVCKKFPFSKQNWYRHSLRWLTCNFTNIFWQLTTRKSSGLLRSPCQKQSIKFYSSIRKKTLNFVFLIERPSSNISSMRHRVPSFSTLFLVFHLVWYQTALQYSGTTPASIFDNFRGGFIWWWNTVSNAWYYFSNKMILAGEIKDAKKSSFSSDFQTLIQH